MLRKLLPFACAMAILAPLSTAHAGFSIAGSLGKGFAVTPVGPEPLNLMVTPGYSLLSDLIRLELGLVADLPDVKDRQFNLQVRPMLRVSPPVLPLYGRLIFGVSNLITRGTDPQVAFGGALGVGFSISGLGIFAEAGVLPTSRPDGFVTVVEGRAGLEFVL